jgi:hypothetical protein
MFADGGVNQQGGTKDPVSGNDVPLGSLQSEVRDDIPAQLSEGEFVIPADVVRYIGLDRLMQIRDKAKEGLARMEQIGQMGNSEEAPNTGEPHGDDFASEIDDIMGELDNKEGQNNLAVGGMPVPTNVMETKQFKKPDGSSMFISFINGAPATPIPEGAQEVSISNQADKQQASLTSTEKAVARKTRSLEEMLTATPESMDEKINKMLFDKISQKATERKNKEGINKNIEFDTNYFKPDPELADFSDALDYKMTDGMGDDMLSSSMNEAASSTIGNMPDMSTSMPETAAIGPELAMAKGGLVARRKK